MKIKLGANLQGLDIRIRPALIIADKVWKEHEKELVVTCGLNGVHSAGSLHYYGLAIDCRTRYFDTNTIVIIAAKLRNKLGNKFDVVVHKSHIHIEYDYALIED